MYAGSDIEANYIASLLANNNIKYIIENTLNESISAGWANGSPYNSSVIKVASDDIYNAKEIINDYIKQHNT